MSRLTDLTSVHERLQRSALTPSERRLGEQLISDYPAAGFLSARELAEKADVSTATVSRLANKLGFESFAAMRAAIRSELMSRLDSPTERLRATVSNAPLGTTRLLGEVVRQDIENLYASLDLLNVDDVEETAALLSDRGRRCWIVGSKKGFVPALYLAVQLNQIRPNVGIIDLNDSTGDHLVDLKRQDVCVVFGPQRPTRALTGAVAAMLGKGITVVGIVDELPHPVFHEVSYLLGVRTQGRSVFASYTAMLSLCNALVARVVERSRDVAMERMEELEAVNDQLQIWSDPSTKGGP